MEDRPSAAAAPHPSYSEHPSAAPPGPLPAQPAPRSHARTGALGAADLLGAPIPAPPGAVAEEEPASRRRTALLLGALGALALFLVVFLPWIPILAGVLLVVAVALHAVSPDVAAWLQPLFRVPVGRARQRYARLGLFAGAGVLLVVSGYVGASLRARVANELDHRARQRAVADAEVSELLRQAHEHLAKGDVASAEYVLLGVGTIAAGDAERRAERNAEVDALLERIHRSGDRAAIRTVLARLTPAELAAFARGEVMPAGLQFRERALTVRSLQLAHDELDDDGRLRPSR